LLSIGSYFAGLMVWSIFNYLRSSRTN